MLKQFETQLSLLPNEHEVLLDKFIYKLRHRAKPHYQAVWESCQEDEKFFLFDLAEDGIANLSNRDLIGQLSRKGLVRIHPKLEIVNNSFANFILGAVDKTALLARNEMESKEGQWRKLRPIMIIVIVAAFGFLSVANEESMGKATALLASIALVIPNLINVIASIGKVNFRGGGQYR